MGAFKHRDVDISVEEAPRFKEDGYSVDGNGKVIYKAGSKYGNCFSDKPQKAVDDQKTMIDRNLDGKASLDRHFGDSFNGSYDGEGILRYKRF